MTNTPLPPEIYRRRRIAALVALVVVLVLLIWALVRCGSPDAAEEPGTSAATESVTVSRTDGSPVTSAPGGAGKDDDEAAEAAGEAPYLTTEARQTLDKDACEAGDVQLTVESDQPNYGPEGKPRFSLTLYNPTRGDCAVDLDELPLRFEVYTLDDYSRVWSDLDCHASEGAGVETIAPGEEVVYTVTWSRLSSAPGACSSTERTAADPGGYLVYGLVGDRNSDAYTFNLR
ncbi:hypothetical protein [Corynebacterium sphenisci]|uniref:hypothetical protein n=1 Tax=Corynebacterium sphenisci TaxID=191493 RepID=UPI0026E03B89|nr:hypothetical protein [Corynebacterium sphenisci]MDO5730114.1 hypothetical protein [Corynebacterium sphenisci]